MEIYEQLATDMTNTTLAQRIDIAKQYLGKATNGETQNMSDYEKVMRHLRTRCNEISGEWNGDESGKQEDRAHAADELLELLENVDSIVKELDI